MRSNQLVCEWKIRTEERTLTRSGTTACTGDEALWRAGGGGTQRGSVEVRRMNPGLCQRGMLWKENGHRKWQSFLHLGLEILWVVLVVAGYIQ